MTLTCRTCPATWSFTDEFSPLLVRDSHTCPGCGRVSRRPRTLSLLYACLVLFAIDCLDGWRLRLTLLLVLIPSLAILESFKAKSSPSAAKP